MLTSGQTTIPLQIFWELFLYSQVIFKSMKVADDTFYRNSECEWFKGQEEQVIWFKDYLTILVLDTDPVCVILTGPSSIDRLIDI